MCERECWFDRNVRDFDGVIMIWECILCGLSHPFAFNANFICTRAYAINMRPEYGAYMGVSHMQICVREMVVSSRRMCEYTCICTRSGEASTIASRSPHPNDKFTTATFRVGGREGDSGHTVATHTHNRP